MRRMSWEYGYISCDGVCLFRTSKLILPNLHASSPMWDNSVALSVVFVKSEDTDLDLTQRYARMSRKNQQAFAFEAVVQLLAAHQQRVNEYQRQSLDGRDGGVAGGAYSTL